MEEQIPLLATLPPESSQKRLALVVAVLLFVSFIAMIPFAKIQLPPSGPYILVVDTIILVIDSITATLLLVQFFVLRLPSLLALAGGYIFTAFMIVPHALTFPNAIAPNGLLGAGLQTTGWLYVFWHMGLPCAVIAYALLKRVDETVRIPQDNLRSAILVTVLVVLLLTCVLIWLTTKGVGYLPTMMSDLINPRFAWHFVPPVALSIIAFTLLLLRQSSVLDLWLLVALLAWLVDALMFNDLITRFSVAWYVARVFSLLAVSFVFFVLLSETTVLYARLAWSNLLLERERENKLMNIDAITASIAHEARQPLAAISANLGAAMALLKMSPPDLHEATVSLKDADEDVHRAADVLDGIRSLFSRGDQPREPVNINDIVLETLQSLRGEMQARGIAANHDLTFDLPPVPGHKSQLQEVVRNLVNNALESMDNTAGRSRKLEITTQRHDADEIVVAVKDTGSGIDAKQLSSIFDAFVTTKSKGMGLGLAICRAIIERHSGRLTAYSDGKNGALFQFVLPTKPSDEVINA